MCGVTFSARARPARCAIRFTIACTYLAATGLPRSVQKNRRARLGRFDFSPTDVPRSQTHDLRHPQAGAVHRFDHRAVPQPRWAPRIQRLPERLDLVLLQHNRQPFPHHRHIPQFPRQFALQYAFCIVYVLYSRGVAMSSDIPYYLRLYGRRRRHL